MTNEEAIKGLIEMEATAELLERQASRMKKFCHEQRRKLEGVSTSSNARKGLSPIVLNQVIVNRRKRYIK